MRSLDRTVRRDVALLCLADGLVGLSFGAIAVAGGMDLWVPVTMSVLVFAGGAQFAAVGLVLSGGGAVAAVVTGLLLNLRLLPFGFAVADVPGRGLVRRMAGAQVITDETVAFALGEPDPTRRRAVFWACGTGLFVFWNVGVVVGAVAGGAITDTDAFGLDAAFPAVLLALLLPALTDRRTRVAAAVGAVLAVATTPLLPAGLPVLTALAALPLAAAFRIRRRNAPEGTSSAPEGTSSAPEGTGSASRAVQEELPPCR